MDASKSTGFRRCILQFRLRTMLLLMAAICVFTYFDPFYWRPPAPVPIRTVQDGETALVDVIELNHRYFDAAERSRYQDDHFDQLLFWSIHPDGKLHLRDWRIVRDPSMVPKRHRGRWVCTWTESRKHRRIEAPSFRETMSTAAADDPEMLDRQVLSKVKRTKLWSGH
jgi:hypothetical protein